MAESVYDIYKNKAFDARAAADRRSEEVWARDGKIAEIDKELSETGLRIFAAALTGDENRDAEYAKLQARVFQLKEEKKERLETLGLPADYTEVKYECPKCSDTGYVGIKMCDCLRRALIRQSYRTSGIGKYLENQTFDNFDVSLYPFGQAREKMSAVLSRARAYATDFSPEESASLLFMGGTGLGKTHISSSIAKCVLDKGYSVFYNSAQNIISTFERERFTREGEGLESDKFFNTDLLIIDDLGAEMPGKSSVSSFYTVINTRMIASKPTIISTNLTPQQLQSSYDERIVSRILGEYSVFVFEGTDIRRVKREKK